METKNTTSITEKEVPTVENQETILSYLRENGKTEVYDLAQALKLVPGELNVSLVLLELKGEVHRYAGGTFGIALVDDEKHFVGITTSLELQTFKSSVKDAVTLGYFLVSHPCDTLDELKDLRREIEMTMEVTI